MLQNRVNILVNTLCRSTVCFERMPYVHTLGIESLSHSVDSKTLSSERFIDR